MGLFAERLRASSRLIPHQAKPTAVLGACFPVIFSNAAGKGDQVNSIERGNHRGQLLAHGIAEHPDGQSCIAVGRGGFMQAPHVAADARNSQQTGTMIDQLSGIAASNFFSRNR